MIKRIIGILASLGVLALVVLTAIGSGSYSSILPDVKQSVAADAADAANESPKVEPAKQPKSAKKQNVEQSDSLQNAKKQ